MIKRIILILFFTHLSSSWADDTIEAAATGNIIFEKAPELIMQDETLTISRTKRITVYDEQFGIDVDFHFKNISDHDITRKIAFVLPPVVCRLDVNTAWRGLKQDDQPNNNGLKDFTTIVDGQSQPYTIKQEAILNGNKITGLLNQLGIPLNPCDIESTADGKPDPRFRSNLIKHHLLTESNDPAWSEQIYFEWTQTFPAGKVVHIQHHYTPVLGESVISPRTLSDLQSEFAHDSSALAPIWNLEPNTLAKTNPQVVGIHPESKQLQFCVIPKWIQYNLTTGANWNGGIGKFNLIIEDALGAPFAVNKFYQDDDNVHTTLTHDRAIFTLDHFIPTQNLFVMFLAVPTSKEDIQTCTGMLAP